MPLKDYLEASLLELETQSFAVEAYLEGSFTKHSSNSGFVADDVVRQGHFEHSC